MIPDLLVMALVTLGCPSPAADASDQTASATGAIVMKDVLAIESVGHSGRAPLHTDAIEDLLVRGDWRQPEAGEKVRLPDGSLRTWEQATAGEDGSLSHRALRGGYVYWPVELDRARTMLLAASGHRVAYVNGMPRGGDPYSTGWALHPVRLHAGVNDFLFASRRGRLRARLIEPRSAVMFNPSEATLPDLLTDSGTPPWAAILVVNTRQQAIEGWTLTAELPGISRIISPVPSIPAMTSRKVAFRIPSAADCTEDALTVNLTLAAPGSSDPVDRVEVPLRCRSPQQLHKRTFISDIDGSVQYYAVNPARSPVDDSGPPALVLSLHGAGVEATNQARSYASKSWCHIVAPTNRRPYGFDWEDWGRIDAIEALRHAEDSLDHDPSRVYLTGHSMGGHGTWQVGVQYPARFAAIGPSAGWISFWSYAGGERAKAPSPIETLMERAASPSDTLALERNYAAFGIYILHGAADDNVPPSEAREMVKRLGRFHHDFVAHEQPGAGHWWNASDEPGADCVDWPAMFDLFARHRLPEASSVREVSFATANPSVSSKTYWAGIDSQIHPLAISMIELQADPLRRRFVGSTENVSRLTLDVTPLVAGGPVAVTLDGQSISEIPWPEESSSIHLTRDQEGWRLSDGGPAWLKNPRRYGPFKEAFRNRMVFVYGTGGDDGENAWCRAKARFDAETFWYRGNGSVDVVSDTRFDPHTEMDRNVILYGDASINTAWDAVFEGCPVRVERGRLRIGARSVNRDDLACLFTWPRAGSDVALVAAICGTGPVGDRLTERMPYFVSGVAYPDLTVLGPETLSKGAEGVVAAGFFGEDWQVESGEIEWAR